MIMIMIGDAVGTEHHLAVKIDSSHHAYAGTRYKDKGFVSAGECRCNNAIHTDNQTVIK